LDPGPNPQSIAVDLERGNGSPDPPRTGHAGRPEAGHGQNLGTGLTGEDYDLMAAVGSGERCALNALARLHCSEKVSSSK
jgi:hypothetical protein